MQTAERGELAEIQLEWLKAVIRRAYQKVAHREGSVAEGYVHRVAGVPPAARIDRAIKLAQVLMSRRV